ncbi:MAG: amidohydrolase [Ardenticatenales bacterium]|nr:amidohydrolase [Ardenticatenales bacterium]
MIVDFHNHYFPPEYLNSLEHGRTVVWTEYDAQGRHQLMMKGFENELAPAHSNLAARIEAMDAAGVDLSVLTMTIPGVHVEPGAGGVRQAQIINDAFAGAIAAYPGRFTALAVLPLHEPAAAGRELRRAVTELGLRGGTLYSHINGQQLDHPDFYPIYEEAINLGVPLWMHPTVPQQPGAMADFGIVVVAGFLHETTVAVCRLLYGGVMERYPDLQLVLSQMGGTISFIAERVERGYHVYPHTHKFARSPLEQLKTLYADTTPHTPWAIEVATRFLGEDKILMGSDFPHTIGDLPGALATIRGLPFSDEVKAKIMGGNALKLLGLKADAFGSTPANE